jgi:hypothetical protein
LHKVPSVQAKPQFAVPGPTKPQASAKLHDQVYVLPTVHVVPEPDVAVLHTPRTLSPIA